MEMKEMVGKKSWEILNRKTTSFHSILMIIMTGWMRLWFVFVDAILIVFYYFFLRLRLLRTFVDKKCNLRFIVKQLTVKKKWHRGRVKYKLTNFGYYQPKFRLRKCWQSCFSIPFWMLWVWELAWQVIKRTDQEDSLPWSWGYVL